MSVTLETVTKKRPEPTAEQVAAEELVRRAREQGICARTSRAANMRSRGPDVRVANQVPSRVRSDEREW
jgi:hypothetical protein